MREGIREIIPRFFIFGYGSNKQNGNLDRQLFEWMRIGVSGYVIFARNVINPFQIMSTLNFIKEKKEGK